ncbi:hypothetical protein [Luteolibacter soli]|uniref:Uncharacterized protein n=1 Tax=Luteolibacter soli TaxID=3135280 RepID=A0ABU9AX57_9BACT
MSFFDFFFPEVAQASHLRRIADQQQSQAHQEGMQRFHDERERRWETSRNQVLEHRVEALERDLGQAGLVIEALLQMLESTGTVKREEIAARAIAIDAADGVTDGRVTPNSAQPFLPRRTWEDAAKPG